MHKIWVKYCFGAPKYVQNTFKHVQNTLKHVQNYTKIHPPEAPQSTPTHGKPQTFKFKVKLSLQNISF